MPRGFSRFDAAQLQARLWTPAAARKSILLWLDADAPQTFTHVSGDVSDWADLSGKGNHATQNTVGFRPTWNGLGGGVTFTETAADCMFGSAALWTGASGEYAVVTLVSNTNTAVAGSLFSIGRSGVGETAVIQAHAPYTDGNMYWDAGSNAGADRVSGAWGGTQGTQHILSFVSSAARGAQYCARDGNTIASDSSGTSVTPTAYWLMKHVVTGYDETQDGVLCEFIVADLTDDWFIRKIEGYIAWKWKRQGQLAAGHPYRNAPPLIGG